jgi:hypothetical protein
MDEYHKPPFGTTREGWWGEVRSSRTHIGRRTTEQEFLKLIYFLFQIIAVCIKVRRRVNFIKMCTLRSNVHISMMNGPNTMILYTLGSPHRALLRPSIFIVQK